METETRPRPIPILDLAAERAALGPELERAVVRALASGQYVLGPEVEAFEREFAAATGVAHALGVASGTDALVVALRALDVGPGDGVVTTPFTFFASASAIALVGARPELADVEPETALLDVERARAAITGRTRCLLPVHLYGQMADVRGLRALADEHGLSVLEDAAQAHGARRDGLAPGALGDLATYSFYPTKNLGAAGEGGLVATANAALAQRVRELRDHGSPAKYVHTSIGYNSRLQGLQGAVLRVKLPWLERWNERRRAIAARYDTAFASTEEVRPLATLANALHARHQYTVRIRGPVDRDAAQRTLAARGIGTGVHYPTPVHLHEAARPWGYGPGDFPVAEALAREVLCLPIHPFLTDSDADRVARELLDAARRR